MTATKNRILVTGSTGCIGTHAVNVLLEEGECEVFGFNRSEPEGVINMMVAGIAGVTLPLMLDRMGIDPAVASGVFVTTVTDVIGFFAFLGLASAILL